MILHRVKCEMCEHYYNIDPHHHPYMSVAPDGWLALYPSPQTSMEGWHFCSEQCLRMWDTERSTREWEQLSAEQKKALEKERRDLADYIVALTELFEKEHPELRLTWQFTLDALLKKEVTI